MTGFSVGEQVASMESSVKQESEISLNEIITETADFGIKITSVGTSPSTQSELIPIQTNVYEIKSNTIITQIVIKLNVTGFTSWNLGTIDIPGISESVDFGTNSTTIGQVFVQVDNLIYSPIDAGLSQDYGFSVPVSQGDHTISALYIGYGEDGIHYAHDSVVIRISTKSNEFSPYVLHEYNLSSEVTDQHQSKSYAGQIVTHDSFGATDFFIDKSRNFVYLKNDKFQPTAEIEFGYSNGTDIDIQYGATYKVSPDLDNFNLNGIVNTTGITGLQILGEWITQPGMTFFIDATGLHSLDDLNHVYLRNGNNYVGLFTLAPYGMWHKKNPRFG